MTELTAISLGFRTMSALLCAGAMIGLTSGCFIVNKAHCGFKEDGADNPCPDGFVCSVCAADNNGCVPIDQMDSITQSCLDSTTGGPTSEGPTTVMPTGTTSPPLTSTTSTTDTTTTSTGTTTEPVDTDTTSTTTMTSSTTSPPDCDPAVAIVDDDCSPQYCVGVGVCGPCTQLPDPATCASLDPMKPVCDADSGVCAECTTTDTSACSVEKPACDAETGTCTECTEHFECPDTACDIETGQCFPPDNVYYVKNSDACVMGNGTQGSPFCNFTQVPLAAGQPTTIKILPGGTPPGSLSIPDNHIIAVVAADKQIPELNGLNNVAPTISVTGAGSRVYLSRLIFRYGPSSVLRCLNAATFYAHDVAVQGNALNGARAIEGSKCKIRVRRTKIVDSGAGIQVTDGDLRVESSYLVNNGHSNNVFGAFNFVNAAVAHINYTTVVLNRAGNTNSTFNCSGLGQAITVRNSAVLGVAPMSNCGASITEQNGMLQEAVDNNDQNTLVGQWFTMSGGVYPPKSVANVDDPLEDKATWEVGDPVLDFRQEPIPQGEPTFAGAEQPPAP